MLRQVILVLLLTVMIQAQRQKPLAHLSASLNGSHKYKPNTDITEFRIDQPFRSFKYENGRLIAEKDGAYFIYAQLFFGNYSDAVTFHNRVALVVNGAIFSYLQTSLGGGGADYGSVFTEGIAPLRAGEYIKLSSIWDSNVWMKPAHTFFGAYKISDIPRRKRQCNKY